MSDTQPNAFEEKIEAMMTQLSSKSAAKRREAAYFLGEAAAADAVPLLVDVYRKDKNAQVRAAAAYSLGMYKAVENEIRAGNEGEVVRLLTQVEEQGEMGRRAPVGRVVKIMIALIVSLVVLLLLYFVRDNVKGMLFASTKSHAEVLTSVQHSFEMVKNDTRTLQTNLLDVISNHPLSCISFYNNPAPYALDPIDAHSFPDIADIVSQMSAAQASLASAKARYDDACNHGAAFGTTEAQATFQLLLPALQALDPIDMKLTQAASVQPTATLVLPTLAPTLPPAEPTTAPTIVAPTESGLQGDVQLQPTIPPDVLAQANPKADVQPLLNLIDTVRETRGASALLIQYWQDVQNTGTTSGCSAIPPSVPSSDLGVPDADLQASPDLNDAVNLIKSGLDAVRTGWTNFQFACNSNTLRQRVSSELQNAQVAANAFDAAEVKLNAVQNAS